MESGEIPRPEERGSQVPPPRPPRTAVGTLPPPGRPPFHGRGRAMGPLRPLAVLPLLGTALRLPGVLVILGALLRIFSDTAAYREFGMLTAAAGLAGAGLMVVLAVAFKWYFRAFEHRLAGSRAPSA